MKRDITRTGVRTNKGALDDAVSGAQRFFVNNYRDAKRQLGIDMMLGLTEFEEKSIVFSHKTTKHISSGANVMSNLDARAAEVLPEKNASHGGRNKEMQREGGQSSNIASNLAIVARRYCAHYTQALRSWYGRSCANIKSSDITGSTCSSVASSTDAVAHRVQESVVLSADNNTHTNTAPENTIPSTRIIESISARPSARTSRDTDTDTAARLEKRSRSGVSPMKLPRVLLQADSEHTPKIQTTRSTAPDGSDATNETITNSDKQDTELSRNTELLLSHNDTTELEVQRFPAFNASVLLHTYSTSLDQFLNSILHSIEEQKILQVCF
jgi:hypothetical protein